MCENGIWDTIPDENALIEVGVLSSSFPMNKLCTQEERRCASWPHRVFPLLILLLFLTF